jgi:hypothetical protein
MPPNTKSVARPSKWGNPYDVAKYGREQAIEKYREGILGQDLLSRRGKKLARVGKDFSDYAARTSPASADLISRAMPMFCWSWRTNDMMRDERRSEMPKSKPKPKSKPTRKPTRKPSNHKDS